MRTLPAGFPLLDLVHELSFSTAQLQAQPLGASYAKEFEALLAATHKALLRQLELVTAQAVADAKVVRADDVLNQLVDQLSLTVLGLTGGEREHPLYQRFFGRQRPSEAKRPILGAQLELMRDWEATLLAAPQPELQALGTQLASAVKTADVAVEALRKAEQQRTDFAELGDCKELLDKVNAARKATHGKLGEAVYKHPERNLPADFAEQFFVREARTQAPARAELVAKIARTEQQLTKLRQQLADQDERRLTTERHARTEAATALREEVATIEKHLSQERARAEALKAKLSTLSDPAL